VTCLLWGVAGAGLRAAIAVAENNPQLRVAAFGNDLAVDRAKFTNLDQPAGSYL
jgi:hypothetical protein